MWVVWIMAAVAIAAGCVTVALEFESPSQALTRHWERKRTRNPDWYARLVRGRK